MASFGTLPDDETRRFPMDIGETRTPFGAGGGTSGGPPAFSGGSEAVSRGTGGGFAGALAPFNQPSRLPPSPQAAYNWGGEPYYELPDMRGGGYFWNPAKEYRGFFDPATEGTRFFNRQAGEAGNPDYASLLEQPAPMPTPGRGAPPGVAFNENLGQQNMPMTPGVLRSLGIPANKVSAQVPREVVQGGDIGGFIGATQPQVTQVHQPEWWESGPLGALISMIPVIGGVKSIAQGLSKGNIGQTLGGFAGILGNAVGGMSIPGLWSTPGAGGPAVGEFLGNVGLPSVARAFNLGGGAGAEGGFEGAANAVGEVPGGSAGMTGGGFTGQAAAPFGGLMPASPVPQGFGVLTEAGGGFAPQGSTLDVGAGLTGPEAPGFWEGMPEAVGGAALRQGMGFLGSAGGPSGLDGGFQGAAAGGPGEQQVGGVTGGAPGNQMGGQTGASRAAGATGPLDMPGARPETPQAMEQRMRAQAMQRVGQGLPIPSFGRMV